MPTSGKSERKLKTDLRSWWKREKKDWEHRVDSSSGKRPTGAELWDSMPTIDSKVATETSPIFEKHLGIPLDTSLIRPGGYSSIDDLISDLVPKMMSLKRTETKEDNTKGEMSNEKGA